MTGLYSIEVWLVALTITVAVLATFGIFARWCAFSAAVPAEKLAKLHVGMKTNEVVALLGPPRDATKSTDGPRRWFYGARMKRHVLLIEFNSHDAVESFAHGVPAPRRGVGRGDNI
jgi:outer membrane protein assembly factor BamE (lipoprotein component of BamABCDE complex)